MPIQLTNNASAQLIGSLTSADTTLIVQQGSGGQFPALPAGDWFPATIVAADGTVEIVRVTARNADTFTIVRGQENTAPAAFPIGSRVELRMTAGAFSEMIAGKLERSGGTMTGPVTSLSTIEADGGFLVGEHSVWHEGTFDPATKLNTTGNQTIEANTFELKGENARAVFTSGEHSVVVGIDVQGRILLGFGTGYADPAFAISADKRIWTQKHGFLDEFVQSTANQAATAAANSASEATRNAVLEIVRNGFVQAVRLGASVEDGVGVQMPGHVLTAWGYQVQAYPTGIFRPLQIKINDHWYTVETA